MTCTHVFNLHTGSIEKEISDIEILGCIHCAENSTGTDTLSQLSLDLPSILSRMSGSFSVECRVIKSLEKKGAALRYRGIAPFSLPNA